MSSNTITSFDVVPPTPPAKPAAKRHKAKQGESPLQARYESARRTPHNKELWAGVDGMSVNTLNDAATRSKLRNRSRYEEQNGGYYSGIINDRANETIGTGPRLQITIPEREQQEQQELDLDNPQQLTAQDKARIVERKWKEHQENINLLDKLLVLVQSETREGEVFGLKFINPLLPDNAPQLDLRLYEADQCTTPDLDAFTPPNGGSAVDGILFDRYGNPIEYHFLRVHPGESLVYAAGNPFDYDAYPARRVIHFFTPKRAGQARGVPPLQSSLPLAGVLRGYTSATLATARLQSQIPAVITQEHVLVDEYGGAGESEYEDMEVIQAGSVSYMMLPPGMAAAAHPSNQPNTSYGEFKTEVVTETGRPIGAPESISTGSAAKYNYSSARLNHQQWRQMIRIYRKRIEKVVLNNLFRDWLREALLIPGYLPGGLPPVGEWSLQWRWDGFVSIDPVKDSTADEIKLRSGTDTLDKVCGERGEDWEEVVEQQMVEEKKKLELRKKYGLPAAPPVPGPAQSGPPAAGDSDTRGSRSRRPVTVPPDDDDEFEDDEDSFEDDE